jgi:hypothetical protein
MAQGGATKRPGSYYIAEALTADAAQVPLIVAINSGSGDPRKTDISGDLDTTWASSGIYDENLADVINIKAFSNGELLFAGAQSPGTAYELHRVDSDGALVTSWGTGGKVTLANLLYPDSMVIDSSDNIYLNTDLGDAVYYTMLDSDGTAVWEKGTGGNYAKAFCMALDSNETRLICGAQTHWFLTPNYWNLWALDATDGTIDTTWGTNGYFQIGASAGIGQYVSNIAIDSEDNIYIYHVPWTIDGTVYSVSKILADGSDYDISWGTNGHSCTGNITPPDNEGNDCLYLHSDGSFALTGKTATHSYVRRYDTEGTLLWEVETTTADKFRAIVPYGGWYYVAMGAGGQHNSHILNRWDIRDGTYDSSYDSSVTALNTVQNMLWPVSAEEVADSSYTSAKVRLVPFIHSASDAYILEFGNNYIQFYRSGTRVVLDTGIPYSITTTYQTADLFQLQFVQSADEMYIAHPDYPPRVLTRYGHAYWTIADLDFQEGPFLDENDTTTTIRTSDITGSVELIASAPIFNDNHVGALWKITHTVAANSVAGNFTADGNSTTVMVQKDRKFDFTSHDTWTGTLVLERSYDDGATWKEVIPFDSNGDGNISYADSETVADANYRVGMRAYSAGSGTCRYTLRARSFDVDGVIDITAVTDANNATGTVEVTLGDSLADSCDVTTWAEGAWSPDQGYPTAIAFYEERLAFAATTKSPETIWMSKTDDWENFGTGALDTDALSFTLAGDQANSIRWLCPQTALLIGTIGSEWSLSASEATEPLTANNVMAKRQSSYGSDDIQAFPMNNNIIFVQRDSRKVRKLQYSFELDNWIAPDLTMLAEHITDTGITQMALQKSPYPILWAVRNDGNLVGATLEESQEILGWHEHDFGGTLESIAVIPDTNEDELWLSVQRTVDSNTVRYVERLHPQDWGSSRDDIFFVDSGLTYDSTAARNMDSLAHLEGETVAMVGDGNYAGTDVVVDGNVLLDANYVTTASVIHAGLPYTARLQPMKLEMVGSPGALFGDTKRIHELSVRFHNTVMCEAGPSWSDSYAFMMNDDPNNVALFSGDQDIEFGGDYEVEGNICLFSDEPLPLTILALKAKFEKED